MIKCNTAEEYEEFTRADLYEEIQRRKITGLADANKGALVAALLDNDIEEEEAEEAGEVGVASHEPEDQSRQMPDGVVGKGSVAPTEDSPAPESDPVNPEDWLLSDRIEHNSKNVEGWAKAFEHAKNHGNDDKPSAQYADHHYIDYR